MAGGIVRVFRPALSTLPSPSLGPSFPNKVSNRPEKSAVASVVGLGGFVGAMGAVVFQRTTGYILEATNSNYSVIFVYAGLAYLVGLLGFHLLAPRLEPVRIGTS